MRQISEKKLLVVEGIDEENFFASLLENIDLSGIQIFPEGGKDKIRGGLKALRATANFDKVESLAIIRDANGNPQGAFQSVRDALAAADLPSPRKVNVPFGANPLVSVFIVPGRGKTGMLEDLCLFSVRDRKEMTCVDEYFLCLKEKARIQPRNISKAKVQVFLAAQKNPGKRLGEAAKAGYWPLASSALKDLKEFLRSI